MAITSKANVFVPEIFADAVTAAFSSQMAFSPSFLATTGAVTVNGTFGGLTAGDVVTVPYFSALGDFEDLTDGTAATPQTIGQVKESTTVVHSALAFESTFWAKSAIGGVDPYQEGARQIVERTARKIDALLIAKATSGGALVKDVFDGTTPVKMSYSLMVDGLGLYGDDDQNIAAMIVHSKVFSDMQRMVDTTGRPLLTTPNDGSIQRFLGVPVYRSNRMPIDGSTLTAVTSAGTSPPTVTVSGTPLGAYDVRLKTVTAGARGTATIAFSTDGGSTWSAPILTAASIPLTDTAVDSLVGRNGSTGITAAYANATATADNTWSFSVTAKHTSMLIKKGALAFWYNQEHVANLQTQRQILTDSDQLAVHLYAAPHMYRRLPGSVRPGVVILRHNAST